MPVALRVPCSVYAVPARSRAAARVAAVAGLDEGAGGGEQVGLGALGDDAAVADDDEVVGDDLDLVEQVGGQQDGAAAVGVAAQEVAHPADAGGVEAVGGFVEDEDLGVADEGGGDAEALAHAEGVVAHAPVALRCR